MPLVLPARTYSPKRLRAAINAWARASLGWTSSGSATDPARRLYEGDQNEPRPALPYLSYTPIAGPAPALGGYDASFIGDVITSATIDVTASAEGEWTKVIVNAQPFVRQIGTGETTTDQRNGLLALIAASIEPVVCTTSGVSSIDIVPEYGGDLSALLAVQGCTTSTFDDRREVIRGLRTWRYRMQLFGGSDPSDAGSGWIDLDQCADLLLTKLYSAELDATFAALQVSRFGERPIPQRATVPSGGRLEQRRIFDVNFSMITRLVSATTPIGIETFAPPAITLTTS